MTSYWLFKSEPDVFGIDHLAAAGDVGEPWDGVRNYQARNFLRDEVKLGDQVFIYHSSCKQVGIAGIGEVIKESYPDPSQYNPESPYFDPKATLQNPRWFCVNVAFRQKFSKVLSLQKIKANPEITQIGLVKKGHRLSIMPVTEREWDELMAMVTSS